MRVSVYLVCAALAIAVRSEDNTNYLGRYLEPVNMSPDQETVSYLLPKLTAKYRPNSDWSGVTDPRFYVLTEMESNDIDNNNNQKISSAQKQVRNKRCDGSGKGKFCNTLSVQAPIETLRNLYNNMNSERSKRVGRLGESGSLSIVNSLDVLRNRLLLEIARKKAKEGANRNRQLLLNLGKRAFLHRDNTGLYENKV